MVLDYFEILEYFVFWNFRFKTVYYKNIILMFVEYMKELLLLGCSLISFIFLFEICNYIVALEL